MARYPDRIAVEVPPGVDRPRRQQVTYARLGADSARLAAALVEVAQLGVARAHEVHSARDRLVVILLPRDSHLVYAAQLAVLRAGAAFTCVEPTLSDYRLDVVLADAEPVAVITDAHGAARMRDRTSSVSVSCVDVAAVLGDDTPLPQAGEFDAKIRPCDLAYVIYTSGTTGHPKGVMIEHGSVSNLVTADLETFALTPDDRVGQGSSCAYDSSIEEIWLAFAAAATLVVVDDETLRRGPDLVPWLRDERITVFCPPPTLLRSMGCVDPARELPRLRLLYVGGEALPIDVANRWGSGRWLENGYGPTECTVTVLRGRVHPGSEVTIGRPIRGHTALVLTPGTLTEVPTGEPGELCIAGPGVARGYWRRPDLTAEKFVEHPRAGRVYRTGDLVRCAADGEYRYLGRVDSQVKLRGHRIELEAIEACLTACPGVRAAACRLQGTGADALIAAHVVPIDPSDPPGWAVIAPALRERLPEPMIPSRFAIAASLPLTVGGKLDRNALPIVDLAAAQAPGADAPYEAPRDALEARVLEAFAHPLGIEPSRVSIHQDFFALGGDSLRAAEFVSRLRLESDTAGISVRDVYRLRTVAAITAAVRVEGSPSAGGGVDAALEAEFRRDSASGAPKARHRTVTLLQALWLGVAFVAASSLASAMLWEALPWAVDSLGVPRLLGLSPVIAGLSWIAYTVLAVGLTVVSKWVFVGRYRAGAIPVGSVPFFRHWIVKRFAGLIPWRTLSGTEFVPVVLRALGARVGRRVHVHRGVDFQQGGWDLLDLGDDVSLGRDAVVRLVELHAGHWLVGPIEVGARATLEVRAGLSRSTVVEAGARVTALSWVAPETRVPAGEVWSGVAAKNSGLESASEPADAPRAPSRPALWTHAWATVALRGLIGFVGIVPVAALLTGALVLLRGGVDEAVLWLLEGRATSTAWLLLGASLVAAVPLRLLVQAGVARVLGRVAPGVHPRLGLVALRAMLSAEVLESAGRWLSGTLYWPIWLRLAGLRIGRGCEISTLIDTVPQLVEMGDECFFADGVYLCGPRIDRGTVSLGRTTFGRNVFLGNHVVVPGGMRLTDDILIGVSTVADGPIMRGGSSWFGQPPFELPRRKPEIDRRLTHEPDRLRFVNRVSWESLRFAIELWPAWVFVTWCQTLAAFEANTNPAAFFFGVVPALSLAAAAALVSCGIGLKWLLLGRVRPGSHPLWSCWCSRWDFHYVFWDRTVSSVLRALEGTLWLAFFLRALGVRIGRRVALGDGFAQVVDPDMLSFDDDATVSGVFQAHTFEDRVLTIDRVRIGKGATLGNNTVVLYATEIGDRARVAPHGVVMKGERLPPDRAYLGVPTRPAPLRVNDSG